MIFQKGISIMYTKEQLKEIFKRISLTYIPERTLDFEYICEIQYACQKTIPYENLDIISGRPLSLEYNDLYTKIVLNHRGGYCFELNGFLSEIYRSLGFSVKEYIARYIRGEMGTPIRRHRVLLITLGENRYLCDAGIGQPAFRVPLLIEDGYTSEQYGETYRVTWDEFLGWVISDLHKGEWRRFYSFTEEEQLNIDYVMPSFWCEHSPDSIFNKGTMVAIKNDTGRITLNGNVFKIFDGENVSVRQVTEDELTDIYAAYFGISYPI